MQNPITKFFYNERGQRIKKESYSSSGALQGTTYYILDLSGNAMAEYNQPNTSSQTITQTELPIYGASRLGVFYRSNQSMSYQLTDHLGNVRAVVTKPTIGATTMTSYADYYPFGEQLPNRNSMSAYRYAFQGQELDPETGMEAFQLRLWDGRIGRWLSTDPYGQYASPYLGMGNNPVNMIDPDGGYSWFGAAWRWAAGGFSGIMTGKSSTGEYGINYGQTSSYDSKGVSITSNIKWHDKPSSSGCTGDCDGWLGSEFIGPTPIPVFNKRENPVDMVDIAALKHDAGYILMGADGIEGALSNTKVLKYDRQLYNDSKKVYDGYYTGMIDTQTRRPISLKTQFRAAAVMAAFGPIVKHKTLMILYPAPPTFPR